MRSTTVIPASPSVGYTRASFHGSTGFPSLPGPAGCFYGPTTGHEDSGYIASPCTELDFSNFYLAAGSASGAYPYAQSTGTSPFGTYPHIRKYVYQSLQQHPGVSVMDMESDAGLSSSSLATTDDLASFLGNQSEVTSHGAHSTKKPYVCRGPQYPSTEFFSGVGYKDKRSPPPQPGVVDKPSQGSTSSLTQEQDKLAKQHVCSRNNHLEKWSSESVLHLSSVILLVCGSVSLFVRLFVCLPAYSTSLCKLIKQSLSHGVFCWTWIHRAMLEIFHPPPLTRGRLYKHKRVYRRDDATVKVYPAADLLSFNSLKSLPAAKDL